MNQQPTLDFEKGYTSRTARVKTGAMKYIYQAQILEMLEETHFGLTPDEAAEKIGVLFTKIRPRFSELVEAGKIEPFLVNGKQITRKNKFDNPCGVYRIKI